jgi:subtilase family serine protease
MLKHTLFQCQRIGIGLAVFCFLTASTASARQQLYGHVPKEVATAPMINDVADAETFHLAITLPFRNQDDLQNLIQNLYDSKNPQYHQFLTPDQFISRFGPTPEDYQKLMDFVQSNGLTVEGTTTNRVILNVTATAADVRRVFHVNLHYYQRPDGTKFYSPDSDPSVDLDLPLLHVSGLDSFAVPYSSVRRRGLDKNPFAHPSNVNAHQNSGTGPLKFGVYPYWGFDYRNAYFPSASCVPSLPTGTGQNIALFELDTYTLSNVTTYESQTGITPAYSPSVTKVVVGPGFTSPGGGELEVELDIEMAMSMAPSANIYVYESNASTFAQLDNLLFAIANPSTLTPAEPLCYQISSSWAWGGALDASVTQTFQQYAADGQSYFQAAGDSGAYIAADPNQTVPMPANETSFMTVVGGTELTTTGTSQSLGSYSGETAWNNASEKISPAQTAAPTPSAGYYGAGSGGICATQVPIPTYQVPFVTGANQGSNTDRNIPDVSMVADYIGVYSEGTYDYAYGTSAAAPLWAGFMALINEQAATQGKGPIGFANPFLYNLASTSYASNFNNIPVGSNNNYWGTSSTYPTTGGDYNLATGLGSPKCALIADIIAPLVTNTATGTPTQTRTPTITPTPTNSPTITNTPTPPTTTTSYAYPQPASGQVFICFNSNTAQQIQINVYSFSGQLITSVTDNAQNSNQNRIPISLQGITPGVYFYVIRGSGGVMCTGKFLAVP